MSTSDHDEQEHTDEIRFKIQALADNELPEEEIEPTLDLIQGSYEYRREYAELLRLKRQLNDQPIPPVTEEWIEQAQHRISRRISRGAGTVLLLGSYLVLLGYAIFTMFADPGVPLIVAVLVAAVVLGAAVLLVSAIRDRVHERKTDKYREIIR